MARSHTARKLSASAGIRKIGRAVCETLEERQLMSLTIDVRAADGSSSATVTSVGQVLNLNLVAVVSDPNGTPASDGVQDVNGNIISVAADGHAVAGNLTAAIKAPFNANGAAHGTFQDLNGDGNIDVGTSFTGSSTSGLFFSRSSPAQTGTSAAATISGSTVSFIIGTLTYTVTSLNEGGHTNINFDPYNPATPSGAAWIEDGNAVNNADGTYQAGTPYVVSDSAIIPHPVAKDSSFNVVRNTPTPLNELAGDDIVVALNPSSVVIVSPPSHGSASLITSGSLAGQIQYTPATGYTGPDSLTYKVSDTDGRVSNVATVNITVVLPPPPTAGAVTDTTFRNVPKSINVLSSDTSVGTLVASSVTVVTQPAHGTAAAQSDGTILYIPASGYTGPDSFTYTVADSNQETSSPGTVTLTVAVPIPPTAGDVTSTTTEGAPVSLNVLNSDAALSGTLAAGSVAIVAAPAHGTAAPQPDGTILYTPAGGYIGSDTFTYTVQDSLGDVSNIATVSLVITHGVPPVIGNITVPVLSGSGNTINVLSNASPGAPLVPSTLMVVTAPTNGTATVNADGTISYTPKAGFVGVDSLTYTVANVNQDVSNPATVSLNVGTTISNAKGATHSLTFTNAAGGLETVSLNVGSAELFFTGTGTLAVAKNLKGTVTGSSLNLSGVTLTGTTKASSFAIKGLAKKSLTLGGITDAVPLGSITAVNTVLSGTVTLNSVGSLNVASISNATLTIASGLPGRVALTSGAVTSSSLTSAVPINSLRVASWTGTGTITAPSIGSLISAGAFSPSLTVTATGRTPGLASARITGAVTGGAWSITGNTGAISAGSIAGAWTGMVNGTLAALTIKAGGLASALTAGTLGVLSVGGDVTGKITAQSINTIRIKGGLSSSTITASAAAGLKQLVVSGTVTNEVVTSGGSIGAVSAGAISGSTLNAGVPSTTTLATASTSNLGSSTIGSVQVRGAFTNSNILAAKVGSASLGTITTDNGQTSFGLAARSINAFAGVFGTSRAHFGHAQLINEEVLQAYVNQQAFVFGDFKLLIEG